MKSSFKLSKSTLSYLKSKKMLYIIMLIFILAPCIVFVPLFMLGTQGNFSWIIIAANLLCLSLIVLYLFNILFVESRFNQLDLLLLSKSKLPKNIYVSKWITMIIVSNLFIFINSLAVAAVFSFFTNNYILFITTFMSSIIIQNLFIIFLTLFLSLLSTLIKSGVKLMALSLISVTSLFAVGVPLKFIGDSRINKQIDFNYDPNQTNSYANLYYEKDGEIKKTIVEKTNYGGNIKNGTLNDINSTLDNFNPINWFSSLQIFAMSKQMSNNKIIQKSVFNINNNNFENIANFFETKPNLNIKALYPIGVKPLFELNHFEIEKEFKELYNELISKGYRDNAFGLVGSFVTNNDTWQGVQNSAKEVLFESLGIYGNKNLLYFLRDKEDLFKRAPDIFSWLERNTTKPFSNMLKNIYMSKRSLFNITNINANNRNEFISFKIMNNNEKAAQEDIDHFKNILEFNGSQIQIDNKITTPTTTFSASFPGITTQAQWNEYIDKESFKLSDLKVVMNNLKKAYPTITSYTFTENVIDISQFHYEYKNTTTAPIAKTFITFVFIIILITILFKINFIKFKKIDLKGF